MRKLQIAFTNLDTRKGLLTLKHIFDIIVYVRKKTEQKHPCSGRKCSPNEVIHHRPTTHGHLPSSPVHRNQLSVLLQHLAQVKNITHVLSNTVGGLQKGELQIARLILIAAFNYIRKLKENSLFITSKKKKSVFTVSHLQ